MPKNLTPQLLLNRKWLIESAPPNLYLDIVEHPNRTFPSFCGVHRSFKFEIQTISSTRVENPGGFVSNIFGNGSSMLWKIKYWVLLHFLKLSFLKIFTKGSMILSKTEWGFPIFEFYCSFIIKSSKTFHEGPCF